MTTGAGEVNAGRLVMDAYVDTTGATRDLQRRIDAEMARIRAKIKARIDVDARRLQADARQAVEVAQRAVQLKVRTQIDTARLVSQVRAAAAAASAAAQIHFDVDVDTTAAAAQLAALRRQQQIDLDVDVDTAGAQRRIDALRQQARRSPINLNLNIGGGGAGRGLTQLAKIPAMVGGIYALGAAIVNVGGGLIAMASAASQAAAALSVIPNLAGVAVQGVAALFAGFKGVGTAVGALGDAQKSAGADARSYADAQREAAQRVADARYALGEAVHQQADNARSSAQAIKDAQRAVGDAVRAAAESRRAAAEAIADAEEAVRDSHEAAREAQEALTDARREAREEVARLNAELRLSAGDEEEALAAVQKAREDLQDTTWDASTSERERRDAQVALMQAENDLDRVRQRRKDLAKERTDARNPEENGIRDAQEALQDAHEAERDAIDALSDARRDARQQEIDNQRAIADARRGVSEAQHAAADQARADAHAVAIAQRELTDAQRAQTQAMDETSAAADKVAEAMANLSPAAQRFARFIFGLKPRWVEFRNAVQEALLPPLQRGIEGAMPLLDTLQTGIVETATRIGRFAGRLGRLLGRETINTDIADIMKSNNRALGNFLAALRNLVVVFIKVAKVAGPVLLEPFAKWVRTVARGWRETLQTKKGMDDLRDSMVRSRETTKLLWSILTNLWGTIRNIGRSATPAGESLLGSLDKTFERWDQWTGSDAGQKRMREFFESTKPVTRAFGTLVGNVAEFIVLLGESGGGPLAGFLWVFNTLLDGINAALSVPYFGDFIGALLILVGVAGGLGMVAGILVSVAGGVASIVSTLWGITGLSALYSAFAGTVTGVRIGLGLLWVQTKLVAAWTAVASGATAVWTAVTGALNAAWAANPLGVVILALVAIGAALVFAYKKFDWFRNVVDTVVGAVVDAATWLWDVLFGHSIFPDIVAGIQWAGEQIAKVFRFIGRVIRVAGTVFSWLWRNAVKPAWQAIQRSAQIMWTRFYRPILRFLWNALKTLGGWFGWLWDKAIKPAWNAIQRGVQIMWNRYYKPILKTLWNALKTLGGWFKWLWEKGVKPAWEKITNALRDGWKFIRERVFNPLIDFLRKDVPDAFERAKNRIKDIWDKVKSIASKPVEFIVKTVYNNGIRKVVNALPGVDNLNPINFRGAARGTSNVLPGYTPGRDVHRFVSPTAGGLELSGGEAVMRPEWTRMVGPRVVDAFNGAARHGRAALERVWASVTSGNTRMALGGILGRGPTRSSATGGEARRSFALGGVIGDLGDLIGNVRDGLVGAASGLGKRVSGWADTLGDRFGPWGSMMGKVVRNVGGQVREWLADKLRSMFRASGAAAGAGTPNGNGGLGPAAIAAANFVRSHFGFRGTIGGYSYRNIAGTNTLSKHALGKAIDIMQSVSPLAQSMYNYFSGPGYARFGVDNVIYNRRIFNASGGHHYYGGVSPHTDHVHVDFYDEGGPLYPGSTFAQNRTGKVETVFTNDNMVEMSRHLAQVATTLTTTDARQQQNAPLVENLTLQARPDEMPGLLSDANWELSRMRRGGVHAQRA